MIVGLKRLVVLMAVAAIASGLICSVSIAAVDSAPVSLDLKDVDVRSAIESLFRGTGRNFAVEPQVTGVIPSLSIRDVQFDVALKSLVRTAGLVYRVDNDIYLISKKPETTAVVTPPDPGPSEMAVDTTTTAESIIDKIPLNNTGASELLGMMNGNSGSGGYGGGMGGYGGGMGGMGGGMGGMGGGMMGGMGGGMMGGMGGGMMGGMGGMSSMGGMGGYGGSSSYGGGSGYGGSSSYGRSW